MKLTVGLKKQGNSYKILSDPNTALSPTLYVRSYMYSQLAKAELIYLAHKHKQLNEWVNNCKVPCPLGKCRLKVSYQLNEKIFTSQTTEQDCFETLPTSTQGTHYKVTT